MLPTATHSLAPWYVCSSLCLSAEPIEMPFGRQNYVDPKVDPEGVQIPSLEAVFCGKGVRRILEYTNYCTAHYVGYAA